MCKRHYILRINISDVWNSKVRHSLDFCTLNFLWWGLWWFKLSETLLQLGSDCWQRSKS